MQIHQLPSTPGNNFASINIRGTSTLAKVLMFLCDFIAELLQENFEINMQIFNIIRVKTYQRKPYYREPFRLEKCANVSRPNGTLNFNGFSE